MSEKSLSGGVLAGSTGVYERVKNDYYATPPYATKQFIDRFTSVYGGAIMKYHIDIVHHIIRCDPTITYEELLEKSTPHLESFMTKAEISEYVFYKFINYPDREEKLSKYDVLWVRAKKQVKDILLAILVIIGIVALDNMG